MRVVLEFCASVCSSIDTQSEKLAFSQQRMWMLLNLHRWPLNIEFSSVYSFTITYQVFATDSPTECLLIHFIGIYNKMPWTLVQPEYSFDDSSIIQNTHCQCTQSQLVIFILTKSTGRQIPAPITPIVYTPFCMLMSIHLCLQWLVQRLLTYLRSDADTGRQ